MSRPHRKCMNCGETREMAAHGLCFACYRREERAVEKSIWENPDRHATSLIKAQRRSRKALMKIIDALEDLEHEKLVSPDVTNGCRRSLQPYVAMIANALVNSEPAETSEQFTKTNFEPEPAVPVNSEPAKASEQFTATRPPKNYVVDHLSPSLEEQHDWEMKHPNVPCPPIKQKTYFRDLPGFQHMLSLFQRKRDITVEEVMETGGGKWTKKRAAAFLDWVRFEDDHVPIEVAEKPTNEHAEAIRQLFANRLKEDTKKVEN